MRESFQGRACGGLAAVDGVISNPGEDSAQIGFGIQAVQLRGTDQTVTAGVPRKTRCAGWRDCLSGQKRKFAVQEPAVSSLGEPRFYAFDLLSCNGEDLRCFSL